MSRYKTGVLCSVEPAPGSQLGLVFHVCKGCSLYRNRFLFVANHCDFWIFVFETTKPTLCEQSLGRCVIFKLLLLTFKTALTLAGILRCSTLCKKKTNLEKEKKNCVSFKYTIIMFYFVFISQYYCVLQHFISAIWQALAVIPR